MQLSNFWKRLLRTQSFDFPYIPSLALNGDFLFILTILKFYQMCPDVDLFSFILLGTRWALSIWNTLSFSSLWTFLQLFLSIFSPPNCSCSLLKELLCTDVKTLWCIFYTSLILFFPDFFFFFVAHTEFLFSSKSTIQSSFMLNCYLAHPLHFFFIIF